MINNSITYSLISMKIHIFYRSFIEPLIGLWHNQGWIVFRRYEKSTALPTCWSWVGLSGYLLFIFINSSEWRTMVTDMSPSVQEMGGEEEYLSIINSCLKAINHQALVLRARIRRITAFEHRRSKFAARFRVSPRETTYVLLPKKLQLDVGECECFITHPGSILSK